MKLPESSVASSTTDSTAGFVEMNLTTTVWPRKKVGGVNPFLGMFWKMAKYHSKTFWKLCRKWQKPGN